MTRIVRRGCAGSVAVALLLVATGCADPGRGRPRDDAAAAERTPGGAPARRLYIDPETGARRDRPPAPRAQAAAPAGSAAENLEEVDSPVPGGGTLVDLKGRFKRVERLERTPDGRLERTHRQR